uniref:PINIT domain-containing protein n=1 Tax=Panagrellus redivivus TaxID=6233 RepID=A0A7E4W9I9_PANRE
MLRQPNISSLASRADSFQGRLQQLPTPAEAHHLQLADIDRTIDLEPYPNVIMEEDSLFLPKIVQYLYKRFPVPQQSKVYPLASYSYSFQRRLRELAAPGETYHLQLADIDQTIRLGPCQTYSKTKCLNLPYNKDGYSHPKAPDMSKRLLLQPIRIRVTPNDPRTKASDLLTPNILLYTDISNVQHISVNQCVIDLAFIEKAAVEQLN